jgi:hypothetical protein
MTCPICGSRIFSRVMEDGEVERACLAGAHPYLTPREIADRDQYLARVNTPRSRREPVTPTYREGSWTDRNY